VLSRSLAVLEAFQRFKGKMSQLLDPLVQAEGLTPLQAMVLLLLAQAQDEITVGTLSEQTHMGQANTSTLCKKLERGGFLVRSRSLRDERIVTLNLTEQGRRTLDRVEGRISHYFELLDRLPPSVGEDIRRGAQAVEYAMDYLQNQIEGEQSQC